MKRLFYIIIAFFSLWSCSNKNSAFINRVYHNTTARYNGYFNSRQSIKEGLRTYAEGQTESYDTLINIFTNTDDNPSSLFPAMDKAIEKSNQVIIDHSIEIRGEEFNKWVDENYLCIARGHFYKQDYEKAIEVLEFTTKKYPDRKGIEQHYSFLIRSFVKNDNSKDASIYLGAMNKLEDLKRKAQLTVAKTNAYFNIHQQSYERAIEFVEVAIKLERKRKEEYRLKYLLAQLYNLTGDGSKAIPILAEISKKSNNYDLAFAAVMMQAQSVDNKVSGYAVKKRLEDMLKDDKNEEYLDQIYYALAEIEWSQLNFKEGLDYLYLSVENSFNNNKQKAKSYNKIADYYYGEKSYQLAKINYDSTYAYLSDGSKKDNLKNLLVNLDELVVELNTIDKNDSLIYIYNLSPEEQSKKLDRVQDKIRRDKVKEKQLQQQAALKKANAANNNKGSKQKGNWYFYNDNAKKLGQKEFEKVWGNRPLVDNWRLKSKLQQSGASANTTNNANTTILATQVDVPSTAELKANLPKNNTEVAELEGQTMRALYQSGIIYKENFNDFDNAIEAYENLISRYDTTSLKLNVYYQLYRLYVAKENQSNNKFFAFDTKASSIYYEDLILVEYPNSEFASLIKNPNYLEEKEAEAKAEASVYDNLYLSYLNQTDSINRKMLDSALKEDLLAAVNSKVLFLSARLAANMRDTTRLLADLSNIVSNYTEEPVYEPALAMKKRLEDLLKIKPSATATNNNSVQDTTTATEEKIFEENVKGTQYYLIICPKSLKININDFKNEIATFNDTYFSNTKLSVNHSFIDNENQIILIKTFASEDEAVKYYNAIEDQKLSAMQQVGKSKLSHFPITTKNFINLFKNKNVEAYKKFFVKTYEL